MCLEAEVVKFLHSCNYDVLAAEQCMNYYFSTRSSCPALFDKRNQTLANLQAQLQVL